MTATCTPEEWDAIRERLFRTERGFEDAMAQRAALLDALKRLVACDATPTKVVAEQLKAAEALIDRCEREVPRG